LTADIETGGKVITINAYAIEVINFNRCIFVYAE
jgi:hypothetical protein